MACIDCKYPTKKTMSYIKWVPCLVYGEKEKDAKISAFWCTKKDHWIYPPTRVNHPILQENIEDEIVNEPMPVSCKVFKNNEMY